MKIIILILIVLFAVNGLLLAFSTQHHDGLTDKDRKELNENG